MENFSVTLQSFYVSSSQCCPQQYPRLFTILLTTALQITSERCFCRWRRILMEAVDLLPVSALQMERFQEDRNCCQIIACFSLATDRVFTSRE